MKIAIVWQKNKKAEYVKSVRYSKLILQTTSNIEEAKNYVDPLNLENEIDKICNIIDKIKVKAPKEMFCVITKDEYTPSIKRADSILLEAAKKSELRFGPWVPILYGGTTAYEYYVSVDNFEDLALKYVNGDRFFHIIGRINGVTINRNISIETSDIFIKGLKTVINNALAQI